MTIHHRTDTITLHHGDCLDILRELPDSSVDAVVTDPPYGLGFMGKEWDNPGRAARLTTTSIDADGHNPFKQGRVEYGGASYGGQYVAGLRVFQDWCELWATECLRVLKPGGHMLAFGGTRTWHRLAAAVEDAGFEIRDSLAWMYGSGFPKSMDVSKAIDKAAGAEREVVGFGQPRSTAIHGGGQSVGTRDPITAPATPEAETWQGWGTALKPAFEPIVVARKPLVGTVAANVLEHGTGALNIDGCRVESDGGHKRPFQPTNNDRDVYGKQAGFQPTNAEGRWPANVILDEHQAEQLDRQSGVLHSQATNNSDRSQVTGATSFGSAKKERIFYGLEQGGASRFFYVAKANQRERPREDGISHPTVKPLELMRWLVRLVTPPGGTVLEPFAGSGTTVAACILEGFSCIAVEREADYLPLIMARIAEPWPKPSTPAPPPVPADQQSLFPEDDHE